MGTSASKVTAAAQLAGFLAKYSPEVRSVAKAARAILRTRLPGAVEFVYDNAYALVIGFGPNERASEAWFSIAIYPHHASICFLQGALLDDPERLLQGNGNQVRHIRLLPDASVLKRPGVAALMTQAVKTSDVPWNRKQPRKLLIRAVSANQRPRRPRPRPSLG
jgi:hypothetical protein